MRFLAVLIVLSLCSLKAKAQNGSHIEQVQFKRLHLASESYESAGAFDINNDNHPDIVSGSYWYEGPDFKNRHYIGPITQHGEYWEDFATVPLDVNKDGLMDYVTGDWFTKKIWWCENPGDNSQWKIHDIDETGNVETVRGWDIDNDGTLEIVPNNPNQPLKFFKLSTNGNSNEKGYFTKYNVADNQGHGLGFGDINSDGRGDFIISSGWLEAPSDIDNGTWKLHKDFDLGTASVPVIVADVNRDGKNDLIVGQAHGYGLDWYEQTISSGNRKWKKHPIDPYNSQYHTMEWVDIDGDGNNELITGKRYHAHNGKDPGANDPIGLYYFKWNGDSFVKETITYGSLGVGKGAGLYFSVIDLNGSGRKDIVVAGKDGLDVFFNEGYK